MSNFWGETATMFTSFVGVYYMIQQLWEQAEIAEFGEYVVSVADSVACFMLSIVVVALLTIWRLSSN